MKALELTQTALYKRALQAVKKGFPHKLARGFSPITVETRIRKAKATVRALETLLAADLGLVVRYSILKMNALDDQEAEEQYPEGYDPDPDELPVTIEDHGYGRDYLILNLLEIFTANKKGKVLEEYLQASRIPKAPKYAKEVRGFLARARNADPKTERVKVVFKLEQKDGYPPVGFESVWAEPVDTVKGLYRIDNIPFFAYGVSLGDIIKTRKRGNELRFVKVTSKSGHSTLRVFCRDEKKSESLKKLLVKRGGRVESSHLKKLFAVSVPKDKPLSAFFGYLEKNGKKYSCEVEDADVNHER